MNGRWHRLEGALDPVLNRVVNAAFDVAMSLHRRRYWPPFEHSTIAPRRTQDATLARILTENATTVFGRRHGFGAIRTGADYRRAVPVQDYESLRPLIEEQERTGAATLTTAAPVLYAQTSGTSGSPKYLPITRDGIDRVARSQRLFASAVHGGTAMFDGKIVGIGSPAVEGWLPGGSPFGSASGLVYEQMPSVVRRKYVLPPEVLAIGDHDRRYETIAALCLAQPDVTGIATANPSTLLRLRAVMLDRWDDLVAAVATGEPEWADGLDDASRRAVRHRLPGDRRRAEVLRAVGEQHGDDLGYHHLWPRLAAITTWTGGSAGFALAALQEHLAPSTRIVELGYSASEVRATIGVDPVTNRCVPLLDDNHYEFVERDERESVAGVPPSDRFLGVHELEEGSQYYVYVTTPDGLYRYDMNDIVEVTGRFRATPTLAFVQKGRGVTNITGEKLSEGQVLAAVGRAQSEAGVALPFFVLLADQVGAHYRLYTESPPDRGTARRLATRVDALLAEANIEYGGKRSSGRLGPVTGFDLEPGTGDAYRSACVAAGQRDTQFKFLHLQYRNRAAFDFDACVRDAAPATERGRR